MTDSITTTPPSLNKFLNNSPNKLVFYLAWHRPLQHNLQLVHQPRKQMKTIHNRTGMETGTRSAPNLLTQKAGTELTSMSLRHKLCPVESSVQARAGDVQDEQTAPRQVGQDSSPRKCTHCIWMWPCFPAPQTLFRCSKVQMPSFNGCDFRCQRWQRELGEVKSWWSSKNAN